MSKRLFIIDAMAMAARCYHAFKARQLRTSFGLHTSALYGSAVYLHRLLQDERPDYLLVCSDSREKTFRHHLYPEYKSHRKPMDPELAEQLPYLFELYDAMGLSFIKRDGLEADDLIGSMIKQSPLELERFIVSGDKDFMQLIDSKTRIYVPQKGGDHVIWDEAYVRETFDLRPDQFIDLLALWGDSADHIPGVKGIGRKGAMALLAKFGNIETIYAQLDQVPSAATKQKLIADREMLALSKKLVTIKCDVDGLPTLADLAIDSQALIKRPELAAFYQKVEFQGLLDKYFPSSAPALTPTSAAADSACEDFAAQQDQMSYQLVDHKEALCRLIEDLAQARVFSFDTETTGLDAHMDHPIGLSFATAPGRAYYVPLIESQLQDISVETIIKMLTPLLQDGSKLKVGHNLKFDYQMMLSMAVTLKGPFADTMIQSHLIHPDERGHSLDACCLRWLNYRKITTESLRGQGEAINMLLVDVNDLCRYACEDADFTLRLHLRLASELSDRELTSLYYDIEMPLMPILANMEYRGIFIDRQSLATISHQLAQRLGQLEGVIQELAGEPFNIQSPKQLAYILYDKLKIHDALGIKSIKKTKSGFSTDVSVLEKLSEHPLVAALLEFRTLSKLKNTYTDALPELIHPKTNRLHTTFQQTITATGRLSSSQPNLQNIPIRTPLGRKVRQAFCHEDPDFRIVSADYSQVELRILAHLAQEDQLSRSFRADDDIHSRTASLVFGIDIDQVTSEQRSQAKAINFGLIYGMGANRLARQTGLKVKDAKDFIARYFASYPRIKSFIQEAISFARTHHFAQTMSGRRRPLPWITEGNKMVIAANENMAVNTPIQGSAADLIKKAMISVQNSLEVSGLRATMLLQVHDELIFECHKDDVEALSSLVKEAMETAFELSVPLKVEVGSGHNWLEAH